MLRVTHFSKERRKVGSPFCLWTVHYVNFQSTEQLVYTHFIPSFLAGSVIGFKGNVGQSAYSASKGGLIGFSRSLAKEVARKKIRVNVVAPGQ